MSSFSMQEIFPKLECVYMNSLDKAGRTILRQRYRIDNFNDKFYIDKYDRENDRFIPWLEFGIDEGLSIMQDDKTDWNVYRTDYVEYPYDTGIISNQ